MRSMTGYGRAEAIAHGYRVQAEVRSVNHKTFKLNPRLGEDLQAFGSQIEALVRTRVERGALNLVLEVEAGGAEQVWEVDRESLGAYYRELHEAAEALQIPCELTMDTLLGLPGVLRPRAGVDRDELWSVVESVVLQSLDALVAMREREGAALAVELRRLCAEVRRLLGEVRTRLPEVQEAYRRKLEERLAAAVQGTGAGYSRDEVLREVVLYTDRSDVTEEMARLDSHVDQMEALLSEPGSVGRPLEFLAQEMFREANTTASKSPHADLTRTVLALKSEVDKIREQVRNVE